MKKRILLVVTVALFCSYSYAQNVLWNSRSGKGIKQAELLDRSSTPSEYQLFSLDLEALKLKLKDAPQREAKTSNLILQFPDANGELKSFKIFEAPVMEPALAQKYPDIKSYAGQGVDNPSETIRFSITVYGLHNMMFNGNGTSYIDPYTKDKKTYIVYNKAALTAPKAFKCGVTETHTKKNKNGDLAPFSVPATDGVLRRYRLAMACTTEYAAFHINAANQNNGTIAQKKQAVLSAMIVTVTRINSIYEKELSITLQLVANNDALIFINSDSFDNENEDNILLFQSQTVIDGIVGLNNYDIGHTVSTGGGGVAQMYSPCSNNKAMGITGLFSPVGDAYDVDFVAHEMGHQFGANHTFNNECGGNISEDTAYETGSGSTIMGYAGVCFPSVQDHSDAYFHRISIEEITDFIKNWGNCSQNTVTGNAAPIADAGLDYTIPKGTPFILRGTATDANNATSLTYSWEQMDLETSVQPPVANATNGPNFRSMLPKPMPERYMPNLNAVIANNLAPEWEVISNVARSYNFAFTVRDNSILGGQVAYDDMHINVSGVAGPFLVVSPNTNVSWQGGSTQTVTWNVAGTTANGVNAAFVDILLSNDGGLTYPFTLATQVANDGSESVIIPSTIVGTTNRIMVRGNNHIFYDISNTNFTITAATPPAITVSIVGSAIKTICKGKEAVYTLSYVAQGGFTGTTTFSATGKPAGSTVVFSPATISVNGNVTVTVTTTTATPAGQFPIIVTATSGTTTKTVTLNLKVLNIPGAVQLAVPANNTTGLTNQVELAWTPAANATSYFVEVATDDNFENVVVSGVISFNSYNASFQNDGTYYWRVIPFNDECSGVTSETFTFTTGIVTGVADNVLTNFSLFPNPNNGNFTVKFNSVTGSEIKMAVYDIRGRQLLNKAVANTGLIEETLSIGGVEAGIYLVNIQDGDTIITKKIIIE